MYDASAFAGSWPFDFIGVCALDDLTANLARLGFAGAAVSPLNAVFDPEPMPANAALLHASSGFDVRPVPVINPSLPTWREHLSFCLSAKATAVKVLANYHRFDLSDPGAQELARALDEQGLTLCVQLRMLDERSHQQLMTVPATPAAAVHELAQRFPGLRILVCGAYWNELQVWHDDDNVTAELSFVEHGHLPDNLAEAAPPERIALGTHSPVHAPEAAVAKLMPSDLPAASLDQMVRGSFERLFGADPSTTPADPR